MKIRSIRKDDTEKIAALWNECFWIELENGRPEWYVKRNLLSRESFLEKLSVDGNQPKKADAAGFWVACRDSTPIGFAAGTVEQGVGHLQALIVHPVFRKKGTGTALFEAVKTCFGTREARTMTLDFGRFHFRDKTGIFEGSPEFRFLKHRGLKPTRKCVVFILYFKDFRLKEEIADMRSDLEKKDGIHIRFYEPGYSMDLSRIREQGFITSWKSIEDASNRQRGLIATHGIRVVGFNEPGKGPYVDPDYRGRNIGKLLVSLGCLEAKKRGAWFSYFRTAVDNHPAVKVYLYTGYRKLGEIYSAVEPIDI